MTVAYKRGLSVKVGAPSVVKLPVVAYRARLTGMLFDSERAFLLPSAMNGIRGLKQFYDAYPDLKVLVTGHTDTQGPAPYNMHLSLDRAKAVAAYLREDVDAWMAFYRGTGASATWGVREDQHMLHTLPEGGPRYYDGATNGWATAALTAAWKRFQTDENLPATGVANEASRRALVTRYLALDGTTLPAGVEVAVHGCGKFHNAEPVGDQVDWAKNRRVEVFLFRGAIEPPPRVTCGNCPEYAEWVKATVKTVDLDEPAGKLEVTVLDPKGQPIAGAKVTATGVVPRVGETGPDGRAVIGDVIPDVYALRAEHEGFEPGERKVVVLTGQAVEATVELEPGRGLAKLRVLLGDDRPAANMTVHIEKPDGKVVVLETDGEGRVALEGASGQIFTLLAVFAGKAPFSIVRSTES